MLTVNELFSGIGSQSAALERLGIDFKVVGIAEIDKYAIKSYEAIHGPVKNYGDISKIEKLDYAEFWTYSFPCQDISVAGKQRGINENTRSGLLYEVERLLYRSIICGEQPKYLMLENVKNLVGKQFKPQFDEWLKRLDELGYNTYWKVLNAKNYGIPQNRERVFAISIRKDIDTGYEFPIGFDNGKRLKDVLESEVDEKYYLSSEKAGDLTKKIVDKNQDISYCIDANYWKGTTAEQFIKKSRRQLVAVLKNNQKALIPQATKQGYIDLPCIAASRGRNLENPSDRTPGNEVEQRLELNKNGTSNTIATVQKDNYVIEPKEEFGRMGRQAVETYNEKQPDYGNTINPFNKTVDRSGNSPTLTTRPEGFKTAIIPITDNFRIRKLTPKECWRLMGFTDEQFLKAAAVNSNSQLYKQAGNSIVVDVLYYIFKNMFISEE